MAISRVFVLRHVERDKKNEADPQALTPGGELTAYAMGMALREKYQPHFVGAFCSPQPRATRTAAIILHGVGGHGPPPYCTAESDSRLDDSSTDKREVVQMAVKVAKGQATSLGIEPEAALFANNEGREAMCLKGGEYLAVIAEVGQNREGDHLLVAHGGALDAALLLLRQRECVAELQFGPGANGGMFKHGEGFVVVFMGGEVTLIESIRQPQYLTTLATVVK